MNEENAAIPDSLQFGAGHTSDVRMALQALKDRYPIDERVREAIINAMSREAIDPAVKPRQRQAARRGVLEAERINLEYKRLAISLEEGDKQPGGNVFINAPGSDVRIVVVEDENWYGNKAHESRAAITQAPAAPIAGPDLAGSLQGSGLRPTVGQNGAGANGAH